MFHPINEDRKSVQDLKYYKPKIRIWIKDNVLTLLIMSLACFVVSQSTYTAIHASSILVSAYIGLSLGIMPLHYNTIRLTNKSFYVKKLLKREVETNFADIASIEYGRLPLVGLTPFSGLRIRTKNKNLIIYKSFIDADEFVILRNHLEKSRGSK